MRMVAHSLLTRQTQSTNNRKRKREAPWYGLQMRSSARAIVAPPESTSALRRVGVSFVLCGELSESEQ